MNTISFEWTEEVSLREALSAPILCAYVSMVAARPGTLFLWQPSSGHLEIQNQMHDLGERLEVGSLKFRKTLQRPDNVLEIKIPGGFAPVQLKKFILIEQSIEIEAGVYLEDRVGKKLLVLPGAYPFTLAIHGLLDRLHFFEPEYPVDQYQVMSL